VEKRELSSIVLTRRAELDFRYWKDSGNQIKIDRINKLVESCMLSPSNGIGKPELLKFKEGYAYSRRIDRTQRLVYRIDRNVLVILSLRFHYEK
jgi:toxin YoeB